MPDVLIEGLTKRFGDFTAVDGIDLHIRDGEMVTLLGPSGCGKTTTLRMLAGLESPDGGRISIGTTPIVDVAKRLEVRPEKRNLGMVFQSYAIWPHMTVYENVRYPLRIRRSGSGQDVRKRVEAALELVGLSGFGGRSATLLSGGQQQRVAFARAIVFEPTLLLLDEPLSNLDARLRDQMRFELKQMQRRVGVTAIYVTHDQAEALSLSDRIVVMNGGVIEQVGTPAQIYGAPASRFVAEFIGKSNMLTDVELVNATEHSAVFSLPTFQGSRTVAVQSDSRPLLPNGVLAIRPEAISVLRGDFESNEGTPSNYLPGKIGGLAYLGHSLECVVDVSESTSLRAVIPAGGEWRPGDAVTLKFAHADVMVVN